MQDPAGPRVGDPRARGYANFLAANQSVNQSNHDWEPFWCNVLLQRQGLELGELGGGVGARSSVARTLWSRVQLDIMMSDASTC